MVDEDEDYIAADEEMEPPEDDYHIIQQVPRNLDNF